MLKSLLDKAQVLSHPFVIGEIACGSLRRRAEVIALLRELPRAHCASDDEVLFFIEQHRLMGRGIGYIDAHLLASVSLTQAAFLWTRDKRLAGVAQRLKLNFQQRTA